MIASGLLFCAGVDAGLLAGCPRTERLKYVALGSIVLLTGCSAFVSSAYALTHVFGRRSLPAAIACGALFGLFVFTIDRFLLTTWKPRSGVRMAAQAAPRLAMAILLALVIAKPLEIRIVHDRISRTLVERRQAARVNDLKNENLASGFTDAQTGVEREEGSLDRIDAQLRSDPPGEIFQSAKRTADRCDQELSSMETRLQRESSMLEQRVADLRSRLASADESHPQAGLDADLAGAESRLATIRSTLATKRSACRLLADDVAGQRREYVSDLKARRGQVMSTLATARQVRDERAADARREIARDAGVTDTAFDGNLVAELEALADLSRTNASVFWIDWTLTLLFLAIDSAPVVMKMTAGRGPYDDAVDAENAASIAREAAVARFYSRPDVYTDIVEQEERAWAAEQAVEGHMRAAVRIAKRMHSTGEEFESALQAIVKTPAGGDTGGTSAGEIIAQLRDAFARMRHDSLERFTAEIRRTIASS